MCNRNMRLKKVANFLLHFFCCNLNCNNIFATIFFCKMNDIKKIRKGLGFSQQHFADYLGIDRGLLSMVEIGKRELPTAALIKLNMLELNRPKNNLPQTVPLVAPELEQQNNQLQTFLQQEQQWFLQKALHLQKQLKTIETKYNTAVQLLQTVRTLQQQLPNTPKNKLDLLWYALTEAMLIEKINANDLVVQKKLQWEIESLQYRAEGV